MDEKEYFVELRIVVMLKDNDHINGKIVHNRKRL